MMGQAPPLHGIRVLDLTLVWAGPYGAMLLGDLGAEVIRVESHHRWQPSTRGHQARPSQAFVNSQNYLGRGYPDQSPGERPWNRHAMFNCHARNKLAMTLDLTTASGVEVLKELTSISDVVVENNTPGTLDKLGVGYESLRQVRSDLIFVAASGLGAWGPHAQYRGFGQHFEASCGHTWLRGYPDEDPSHVTVAMPSDGAAGASIAAATLMALYQRLETGEGQFVDLSLVENFLPYLAPALLDAAMNGRDQKPMGNRHPFFAPQGVYPCKGEDRWVALTVQSDTAWEALVVLIADARLTAPHFETVYGRLRHQDEIDSIIGEWSKHCVLEELVPLLQQNGITAGGVLNEADVFCDQHLRQREFWLELEQDDTGKHDYPGMVWRSNGTASRDEHLPPCRLGEHNGYVYRELLSYGDERYQALCGDGHIGVAFDLEIP